MEGVSVRKKDCLNEEAATAKVSETYWSLSLTMSKEFITYSISKVPLSYVPCHFIGFQVDFLPFFSSP